ncbi:MAG: glycosyltransferase [Candidatus Doudnabacteria bacterium]|nr:glycosyltransferase [Candidatus Doudnabacteria bacterium]
MKIALVHDVLNQIGGAEKVLENFLQIWPEAVIHTVFYDEQKTFGIFAKYNKKISALNSFPFSNSHPKLFFPVIPLAFESFKFDDYEVVISDSSAFAKYAKAKNKLHICYCHTPTRFLWTDTDYIDKQSYPFFLKILGELILPLMRKWDFAAAQRPNYYIANSRNVQDRIKKYYNRDSVVIPPPVDTERFYFDGPKSNYFFVASRLEAYKNIEIVVEAFNELGWPLKVAGTGSRMEYLKTLARSNIQFVGRISDDELRKCYSEAKAFVFPADEDAGIMVVESQACGTPVIAYGKGGSLETVIPGKTGEFFSAQTKESLIGILKQFDPTKYDPEQIRNHAMQYDKKNFQNQIRKFVEEKYQK